MKLTPEQIDDIKEVVNTQLHYLLNDKLNKMEMTTPEVTVKSYRMTDIQVRIDIIEINHHTS